LNGLKFRRQHPLGRNIADFYCAEKRLAIEFEGGVHRQPRQEEYDRLRQQAVQLAQAQLQTLADQTLNLEDFWRLNEAQWMWLLRQNLGQVASMSELVSLYQKYQRILAPLMRRLQRTDWLIDQVVYQLYGLTEEEIAVVEGG
jgi:hypothetical protein